MAKKRLKTIEDVRRYLGSLINRTENGELNAQLSGRLAYISSILLRAVESSDLEKRIEKLEKSMEE
jgi:hypothetical protein